MKIVKCDFCPKTFEATKDRECAWYKDEAIGWICETCDATSEALYQESDLMREINESNLAESEPSDMLNYL